MQKNNEKYGDIPIEFRGFVSRNGLDQSSGPGYERRGILVSLTGFTPKLLRDYIVSTAQRGSVRATRPKIARLSVAMRITGDLALPNGYAETLEHAYYLGVFDEDAVKNVLEVKSEGVIGRISLGSWSLGSRRRGSLERFLAERQADIEAAEKRWRDTFVAQGYVLVGHAAKAASSAPQAPAKEFPDAPTPEPLAQRDLEPNILSVAATPAAALVQIAATHINSLLPLVEHIATKGTQEDRARLRQLLPDGPGNKVFRLQVALAPLCSETAARKQKK